MNTIKSYMKKISTMLLICLLLGLMGNSVSVWTRTKKAYISFPDVFEMNTAYVNTRSSLSANYHNSKDELVIVPFEDFTYKSSNPKVISIDKSGNYTCKKLGKATLTVSYKGASKKITINVVKHNIRISSQKDCGYIPMGMPLGIYVAGSVETKIESSDTAVAKIRKLAQKDAPWIDTPFLIEGKKEGNVVLSAIVNGEKVRLKVKVGPAIKLKLAKVQDTFIDVGMDEDHYAVKMNVKNNGTEPITLLEKVLLGNEYGMNNWGINCYGNIVDGAISLEPGESKTITVDSGLYRSEWKERAKNGGIAERIAFGIRDHGYNYTVFYDRSGKIRACFFIDQKSTEEFEFLM